MPILGVLNLPTLFTLGGVALAMGSVLCAHYGQPVWAVICLMYAGVCDLLDGIVARRTTLSDDERRFGVHIDTVADMASFGVAPPVMLLLLGLDAWPAMLVYTLAAAQRLAWFNTHTANPNAAVSHYTGLPVTYAALVFPVVLLFCGATEEEGMLRSWPVHVALWALALAFVAKVEVPKPRGVQYALLGVIAVLLTGAWASKLASG